MQIYQTKCGDSPFKELDLHKIKVSCASCSLSELCLPRGMGPEALEKLENIIKRAAPIQRGEMLYRAGEEFKGLYAVRSGLFKAFVTADDGEGNPVTRNGKYTTVWRQQEDGQWKVVSDKPNFDRPAPTSGG